MQRTIKWSQSGIFLVCLLDGVPRIASNPPSNSVTASMLLSVSFLRFMSVMLCSRELKHQWETPTTTAIYRQSGSTNRVLYVHSPQWWWEISVTNFSTSSSTLCGNNTAQSRCHRRCTQEVLFAAKACREEDFSQLVERSPSCETLPNTDTADS